MARKQEHRRIWNKKTNKMLDPKTMDAKEGHKGEADPSPEKDRRKQFLSGLTKQIKKAAK